MKELKLINGVEYVEIEKTMSSLEIVELINKVRNIEFEEGRRKKFIKLRHDHFMDKVPLVLGEALAPKFLGTNKYQNGKGGWSEQEIYKLPEREAWLMAMSYSYVLQAYIYDAMQESFAINHDIMKIAMRQSELRQRVNMNGSEWGRMGNAQKKNKQTLSAIDEVIQTFAQLKLFN